jgi:photosystem II stability/assembly factor-like uncharacterized protein
MSGRGEEQSPPGGHAEQRRREFERERGVEDAERDLDFEAGGEREGPSGKAFLRAEEFLARRGLARGPGELSFDERPPSLFLRGSREKEALQAESPPSPAVAWRSLGPAGIPHGQTYGSGPGATTTVAGRVAAIAVDPLDSKHLLVGSAAGGIWETRDTGATWVPRTDDQPTLSIGALAFDPSDPSKVYAGTGEGNWGYSRLGHGILRSDDGGSTWTVIAGSQVFTGFGFYRLLVDPRDGDRLLVASTGAAAISSDAGQSWSQLHRGRTWDLSLAYLGDEPEILLAAPDGLFAARGSAAPTKAALPGLPASGLEPKHERMAVAHVPSDPGQAFVFAAAGGKEGPAGWEMGKAQLWHRAAADQPFAPVPLPPLAVAPHVKDAFSIKQAPYDWYVAVPPQRPDVVYLGAIELVRGERSGAGWSWSDISSRAGHGDSIHPDQHTMAFDAQNPDAIYAGNDGGIFRSPDGGDAWQSLNAGLAISEVEYLTQRPDEPTWILAGLQDNGTVRREGDGKWAQVGLGDGGDCATNMAAPDTCFSSYIYLYLSRSKSRGDPTSWEELNLADPKEFEMLFYSPLEVNGEIVAMAGEVVCLSTDGGDSWHRVALPKTSEGEPSIASALAIPSSDRVLAGTIFGDAFRIDRAAGGWGPPTMLAKSGKGWISDLLVDADVPHRYWATSSAPGSVLRSDDEGATWTDVTANLPQIPVHAIVSDPADRDRIWVACDVGVFESTDAGGSWSVYGTGLPNALAEDLVFYEPERRLRSA